jgi:signal transduction histidine kinase/HAMP domain-containing protein/ActR/RegA family two-component response regulator
VRGDGHAAERIAGIIEVLEAVRDGDLAVRAPMGSDDALGVVAATLNEVIDRHQQLSRELLQVIDAIVHGDLSRRVRLEMDGYALQGESAHLGAALNALVDRMNERTNHLRAIADVTNAVANGDLSRKISVEASGEVLELKTTINAMVDQLRTFAAEVTRVAREVGTEGKLGGQAAVPGVAGTWKDLTDNVNQMASNLTDQVRGIVKVVTAVANGDLSKRLIVEAKGEIAALADTINGMTETLRTFADQVTTVAREVGIEGKLGGQARVPGAAGTWRDLVDNVNQLAGNLTTQVRAISNVATAVTKGDLTRTIDVGAQGEVLSLKDTINQMIANLRDTTQTNKEQDWLKTNLAKFTGMMQGQRSLDSLAQLLMSELTPAVSSQIGTFFVVDESGSAENGRPVLRLLSSYGYKRRKSLASSFSLGEGLVGQAALEKKAIVVTDVPDAYLQISSSIGEAAPRNIAVLPVLFEGQVKGVIELGSFQDFSRIHLTFLEQLMLSVGVVFNMISASRRTEELLQELQRSNAELGKRSRELEDKASLLEVKNSEIADASASLEEKAKQLALVSRYKSEFLANMSHELRTPLNSMLILSNLLAENCEGNLSAKQLEYVRTIATAGQDLLTLISQILDLSKIEAGKMQVEKRRLPLAELRKYVERHFLPIAQQKGLEFCIRVGEGVPPAVVTDAQRLEQILKNLLSNAFKFTDEGAVTLEMVLAKNTRRFQNPALRNAPGAIGFVVSDTGIGIPLEKQQIIFEAFQQADASTSRTYGGTGLGLTISRELARLLGGEIMLESHSGAGSTFTLFLPLVEEERVRGEIANHLETAPPEPEPHEWPALPRIPPLASHSPPHGGDAHGEQPFPDLSNRTVLVVDDDVRNLFAITSLLEAHGAEPLSACSAREAVELLERHANVDLVLMDIMMPEVDGYEATRRIRSSPRFSRLPIIALTAKAMPGDREKCLAAGCDEFIAKPVDGFRLIETIHQALAAKGKPS